MDDFDSDKDHQSEFCKMEQQPLKQKRKRRRKRWRTRHAARPAPSAVDVVQVMQTRLKWVWQTVEYYSLQLVMEI